MRRFIVAGVGVLLSAASLGVAGQAFADGPDAGSASSTSSGVFVRVVGVDLRMCPTPSCGGYYVRELNVGSDEYVSSIDTSSLDSITIRQLSGVAIGEEVLLGTFGPVDPNFGVRAFIARQAWRGMPGIVPASNDGYYSAADRAPAISCAVAPCPNEIATLLNTTNVFPFDSFSVTRAASPWVDQTWLVARLQRHNAVAAAQLVSGAQQPGGVEQVLDASQVFVALPYSDGPCPLMPIAVCSPPLVNAFQRNSDRCLVPDGCASPGACPTYMPACAVGYSLHSWIAQPSGCPAYACDPTFIDNAGLTVIQPTALTFSGVTSHQMTVSWTPGTGDGVAVFVAAANDGVPSPQDGTEYAPNPNFAASSLVDSSGWRCVYSGTDTTVTVTGLSAGTTYRVIATAVTYTSASISPSYDLATTANNPANETTLSEESSVPAIGPWGSVAVAMGIVAAAAGAIRRRSLTG